MRSAIIVWATLDRANGIALITGRNHDPLVLEVAPQSKWSKSGGGWILTMQQVADLCSLCAVQGAVYRERQR